MRMAQARALQRTCARLMRNGAPRRLRINITSSHYTRCAPRLRVAAFNVPCVAIDADGLRYACRCLFSPPRHYYTLMPFSPPMMPYITPAAVYMLDIIAPIVSPCCCRFRLLMRATVDDAYATPLRRHAAVYIADRWLRHDFFIRARDAAIDCRHTPYDAMPLDVARYSCCRALRYYAARRQWHS